MKKITLLGIVFILLAFSAVPVLAAGSNHGQGKGVKSGQTNTVGDQNQVRQQDKVQSGNNGHGRKNAPGLVGRGNLTSKRMQTPFYLQGTISAIDTISDTLTISVTQGNAQVKSYIGLDLTLSASQSTDIFKITQGDEITETESAATSASSTNDETSGNRVAITFGDLAVGDSVAIHGRVVGGVYQATLITVYVNTPTSQLETGQP